MATQAFTGWSFGDKFVDELNKGRDRKIKVDQLDEENKYRYKSLAETIEARKGMERHRENQIAEQIQHNRATEELTSRGQDFSLLSSQDKITSQEKIADMTDKTRRYISEMGVASTQDIAQMNDETRRRLAEMGINSQEDIAMMNDETRKELAELGVSAGIENREDTQRFQRERDDIGRTREEREAKTLDKAMLGGTVPTFDFYDQNEAVTDKIDIAPELFDEGEFTRATEPYIASVTKSLPILLRILQRDPNDATANKHLDDLGKIYEVLDSGEYSGPLDSTIFNWFDGEADKASKQKSQIENILRSAGKL